MYTRTSEWILLTGPPSCRNLGSSHCVVLLSKTQQHNNTVKMSKQINQFFLDYGNDSADTSEFYLNKPCNKPIST